MTSSTWTTEKTRSGGWTWLAAEALLELSLGLLLPSSDNAIYLRGGLDGIGLELGCVSLCGMHLWANETHLRESGNMVIE